MSEQKTPAGRRSGNIQDYDDPAISKILQELSALSYQTPSTAAIANPACAQHYNTASVQAPAHMPTDGRKVVYKSGSSYSTTSNTAQQLFRPSQVITRSDGLPLLTTLNDIHRLPVREETPIVSLETSHHVGAHSTLSDRHIRHSSGSLTVDSSACSYSSATTKSDDTQQAIRQPKGPQDAAHDMGFGYAYRLRRSLSKPPAIPNIPNESIEDENSHNQVAASNQIAEHPILFPNTGTDFRHVSSGDNSTHQYLQSVRSSPSSAMNGNVPARLGVGSQSDVYANQIQPTAFRHSRGVSSETSKYQNQMIARPSTNSGPATTMFHDQGQVRNQPSTITRPQQWAATKPFIPSTMALADAGKGVRDPARMPAGSKYMGDAFSRSYQRQVPGLADHLNCSLWLKGLPPNVRPSQIFDLIRCGAVWSLDLKPPTGNHTTVAATLTFMTPYAAAVCFNHCQTYGLQVGGYWISASYNKFGIPEITTRESRVLHVEGPAKFMTPGHWDVQFKKACRFQMDRWSYLPCSVPGNLRMEFRFVRVDGQAQSCRQMIERELGYLDITVCYGLDPCGAVRY